MHETYFVTLCVTKWWARQRTLFIKLFQGNTAQRTARQMRRRFFVRLYSDDDAILYVSLGGTVQDGGKDGAQMMR